MSADRVEKGAPVTATLTLTQEDLEAGILEMSVLYRWRGLLLALFVMLDLLAWRTGRLVTREAVVAQALTLLSLTVFAFVGPRLIARRQHREIVGAGDGQVTYRFDDQGVTIRSAVGTSTVAYRSFVKVREGRSSLLLYTTSQIASIVPLRAFSADERARVLAFLPRPAAR